MTDRVPFLSTPYSAYHQREMSREDEELTRVGPGTPGGEYLRRFWQPILLSQELQDLPRRIRIMGEDLIAFRDKSGAAGLLEPYCAHRGVSLEYGLIAEKGIRCCYHGWCFDVDGTILETPGEPPDSTLKDRLCQGAYPPALSTWLPFVQRNWQQIRVFCSATQSVQETFPADFEGVAAISTDSPMR